VPVDDTKERILTTALSLFAARGYNAVGVQEVCEASSITKPTLYYHYGSKRGLLEAIAKGRYESFVGEFAGAAKYRGDIAGALFAAMNVFLRSADADADFARLRLALAFSPPESEEHTTFRPWTERLYVLLRKFFVDAAQDHGNMKKRDLRYAASFIGTADAYVGLQLARALRPDAAFVREVVRQFLHGVFS
jgi:AcrR family transcriptional regulator